MCFLRLVSVERRRLARMHARCIHGTKSSEANLTGSAFRRPVPPESLHLHLVVAGARGEVERDFGELKRGPFAGFDGQIARR